MTSDIRERIAHDIRTYGFHVYIVAGGPCPRWAYTIGLSPRTGFELVLAGGAAYLKEDVLGIIDLVASHASENERVEHVLSTRWRTLGLSEVCADWCTRLLLGANDYYGAPVQARQVAPDRAHRTIDVPDLSKPLAPGESSPWRWLHSAWPYSVSSKSQVMTDMGALTGATITEVTRWEDDYWEAFSCCGPEVNKEAARLIPLGTLLSAEPSLRAITELGVGEGIRREPGTEWKPWRR